MKNTAAILLLLCLLISCSQSPSIKETLKLAGGNCGELEKVLEHYKNDKQKLKAAKFLIANMADDKFSYEGEIINRYDTLLYIFQKLRADSIYVGEPPIVKQTWDSLQNNFGEIDVSALTPIYDCQMLKSDFLIRNIDAAFEAWQNSKFYSPANFETFCEYILPYRIANEPVEEYRKKYYERYRILADTAKSAKEIANGFNLNFKWEQHYRASNIMWDYPLELSVSKMEIARRGGCRQLTTFETLAMRACGVPVTIDRAIWANRSIGHSWNVILLDSGKIFPFDAFDKDSIKFAYKPAKIFRKKFSFDKKLLKNSEYLPENMLKPDETDVTEQYCNAVDLQIPIIYNRENYKHKKYGVICAFDNKDWRVVHYGKIRKGKMYFDKMAADVVYLAAFYDEGEIQPASNVFLLKADGKIQYCVPNYSKTDTLRLTRKYPRFKRIEDFAWGVRRTNAEGANTADFKDAERFFSVYDIPFQWKDFNVKTNKKFRFFRFNSASHRQANYAEVEFYGRKTPDAQEKKLTGKIIGFPPINSDTILHPYFHAMDGNLETWFDKPKNTSGWVGIDLGKGNSTYLTKIRFCPRSDTNFILEGDDYELMYWDREWKSAARQTATDSVLFFCNVPSETLYLLHNHT